MIGAEANVRVARLTPVEFETIHGGLKPLDKNKIPSVDEIRGSPFRRGHAKRAVGSQGSTDPRAAAAPGPNGADGSGLHRPIAT